jgi:hypothetical protein
MTMTIAEASAPPSPRPLVRLALVALGAILTLRGLVELPIPFHDFGHTDPLLVFAQRVMKVQLVIAPFIAVAGLAFAATGRPQYAIVAFATIVLVGWVTELPAILIHGFEFAATVPGLILFVQQFVYPLLAAAAIALATRDVRLPLATALVIVPPLVGFLGFAMFAMGIAIHGF